MPIFTISHGLFDFTGIAAAEEDDVAVCCFALAKASLAPKATKARKSSALTNRTASQRSIRSELKREGKSGI